MVQLKLGRLQLGEYKRKNEIRYIKMHVFFTLKEQ